MLRLTFQVALSQPLRACFASTPAPVDVHSAWAAFGLPLSITRAHAFCSLPCLCLLLGTVQQCDSIPLSTALLRRRRPSNLVPPAPHPIPCYSARTAPATAPPRATASFHPHFFANPALSSL